MVAHIRIYKYYMLLYVYISYVMQSYLTACTSAAARPVALVALARCSGAHDGDAVRCRPWHLKDCTGGRHSLRRRGHERMMGIARMRKI